MALDAISNLSTIYFGGGSPALCDLSPLFDALRTRTAVASCEFTVELHPLDAQPRVLEQLKDGGVNRISLGVQSLDDDVLKAMGRLHTAAEAETAFRAMRAAGFTNAGIDLIAGWPGTTMESWRTTLARATALGLDHCSVYTLIREPKTRLDLAVRRGELVLPSDDAALAQIDTARAALAEAGLARYEISNYADPASSAGTTSPSGVGRTTSGWEKGRMGASGLCGLRAELRPRCRPRRMLWNVRSSPCVRARGCRSSASPDAGRFSHRACPPGARRLSSSSGKGSFRMPIA